MSEEWRSYEHTGYCWTCDGRTIQLSHGGGGADRSDGGKAFGRTGRECKIGLHGSFLATGRGHGTDRAIVAGLLGLAVDDQRIPESFAEAKRQGFRFPLKESAL